MNYTQICMPLGQPFLGEFKWDTKVVYLFIYYLVVNIKPPMHRFNISLCLGLAINKKP